MGKAIGFRVAPGRVTFAVVGGSSEEPVLVDDGTYAAPDGYGGPEALAHYRASTLDLVRRHEPTHGGMKLMEPTGFRGNVSSVMKRLHIEGVILEILGNAKLTTLIGGHVTIGSRLGAGKSGKEYVDRDELRGLDMSSKTTVVREAIVAATAALAVN